MKNRKCKMKNANCKMKNEKQGTPAGAGCGRHRRSLVVLQFALCILQFAVCSSFASAAPLPNTAPLALPGDIASTLVDGVDRFLLRETEQSIGPRKAYWKCDFSSGAKYAASIEPQRRRLAHLLGVRDPRPAIAALEYVASTNTPALIGRTKTYEVFAVRWPAFGDVYGEGLLAVPRGRTPVAHVVAVPDADQTPEMLLGLADGIAPGAQFARRLAENGCRVIVPLLVDRSVRKLRSAQLTNREYLYRSAFELGRHVTGYEVQIVLAAVDFFAHEAKTAPGKIGLFGWGEGGRTALFAAALDTRIQAAGVSGYFDARQDLWQEPLDRNLFGLLAQFGDAELAAMIAPRTLVVEAARGPEVVIPPGTGGGPGRIATPELARVQSEFSRAKDLVRELQPAAPLQLIAAAGGQGAFGSEAAVRAFLKGLAVDAELVPPAEALQALEYICLKQPLGKRQARLVYSLSRHNQQLLASSAGVRKQFFAQLDTKSLPAFEKSIEWYRDFFYNEVIGRFDRPLLPPNVRTRQAYDEPKWTGYEVVMDVFPDVIAYGILLVPKGLAPGEQRPVVVCQHGLEGRPQDTLAGGHKAYAGFATALAERGFIAFAPQNLYLFKDRFRSLQRKANPLGKTLFSVIVPQHQQIVDWLGRLPFVDAKRIAFYGLSYGGKSAMRIPPLVKNYCLSICSGDFDDWVWKNASIDNQYTYVNTGEYEIFEFDLGSTFNYAEMAALIAPRPFMVERGHFDGVAPDEAVGYEFAKVRNLYQAKLGIGERSAIEWFVGPHMIHGQGTYEFLHRELRFPQGK